MKKIVLVMFFILMATTIQASNWHTAVEIYGNSVDLKPYKLSILSQTFDRKGQLEKTEELTFHLDYSLDEDNPERELILALEDGKDVTEEKRKELAKGRGDSNGPPGNMEDMQKMPLDPAVQTDVSSFFSGRTEIRNGITCEVWNFEIILNDKYTGVGTAWLIPSTGAAASLEYRIEPLFHFVEEMNMGMEFGDDLSDRWVMHSMNMAGKINMLVMKKGFKSIIEFDDYR
ncbi:MAG TPA: hypothetical protein DCO79_00120 [Spirochaeta sp.]|nr:hypothetical protein [Spirochaeta sp.]